MQKIAAVAMGLLMALTLSACGGGMKIIEKPVSFSENRIELTKAYIESHYGLQPDSITIVPKIIVLHWTAVDDFDRCYDIFNRETLAGSRPELARAGQVNVAIQFLVDRDGKIYQLMPDNWMARHCIGINYCSIGVENVGGGNGIDNLTDAQIRANIQLVRHLVKKYPTIEYLIGHYEYRVFEGHPLWLEKDPNYRTEKIDPGARFMTAVRRGVADLHLKGPKEIEAEKQAAQHKEQGR